MSSSSAYKLSFPTFRRAVIWVTIYASVSFVLFGLMYWKIAGDEISRLKSLLELQAAGISLYLTDKKEPVQKEGTDNEIYRLTVFGVFENSGAYLQGNLRNLPENLPLDGKAHSMSGLSIGGGLDYRSQIILVGVRLPDQRILVIGRAAAEVVNLEETVKRALVEGVIPLSLLSIVVGAIVSRRMSGRLRAAQAALSDIKVGKLQSRLPLSSAHDEFDTLSEAVNEMLSELERAIHELHNVGNNIAHDLRTPLSRVRAHLEHAQRCEVLPSDVQEAIERATAGLDQTLAITTSMLRVAQIEAGGARSHFSELGLQEILRELVELYEPLAENKSIKITSTFELVEPVRGDRDLIMEAIANLVDNSIKFTPQGGAVAVELFSTTQGPIVRVSDTGPGIPQEKRLDVFKRFYRCSESRDIPGTGLGLTLVAAVARLHNFHVEIMDGAQGCEIEVRCFRA